MLWSARAEARSCSPWRAVMSVCGGIAAVALGVAVAVAAAAPVAPAACKAVADRREERATGRAKARCDGSGGDAVPAMAMLVGRLEKLRLQVCQASRNLSADALDLRAATTPRHALLYIFIFRCSNGVALVNWPHGTCLAPLIPNTMLEISCPSSAPSTGPPQSHSTKLPTLAFYVPCYSRKTSSSAASVTRR